MAKPAPSRQDQKAATRLRLLRTARAMFAKRGYDATSVGMLCQAARVTHGALYHHFPSKADVFAAVVDDLTMELAARVELAAAGAGLQGWQQVEAAANAYLDACTDTTVQRLLFRDAPRVLTAETSASIDRAINEPLVVRLVRGWMHAGVMRDGSPLLVARILGAAFAEAGAAIEGAADPRATRREAGALLLAFLGTLRARSRAGARASRRGRASE